MTPTTITISGAGSDLIERLRSGIESNELIDLFGIKFAGVKFSSHVWEGEARGTMIAQEVVTAQPAPWSGDGLPPIGAVCEMHIDGGEWVFGTVAVHIDLDRPVAVAHNGEDVFHGYAGDFRPIKTPAQVSAELADQEVKKIAAIICRDGAFDIDDPEVSESAVALYDAGLRFTEGSDK